MNTRSGQGVRRRTRHGGKAASAGKPPPPASSWKRISQGLLSDNIIHQIRSALFAGQLKPGDYLGTEASLSASFGVSRVAIRDALRALQANGIIESRKGAGGGIRIAHGDPARFADALAVQLKLVGVSIREIIDAHFTIETAAAELATKYATKSDLNELRALHLKAESCVALSDMQGYIDTALEFHSALAAASHNRALSAQLRGYLDVLKGFYRERATPARGKRVLGCIVRVIDAIEQRDQDKTRRLMIDLFRPLERIR